MKAIKRAINVILLLLLLTSVYYLNSFMPRINNPQALSVSQIKQKERFKIPTDLMLYTLFHKVDVYYDGVEFTTDFDVATLKNKSAKTYYVSPNGNASNSGLSREQPLNSVATAYNLCESRDTLVLLEGIYKNENWFEDGFSITKSINLIGEGNVLVTQSDNLIYSKNATYSNVWQADCVNVWQAIDLTETKQLCKVESIESCNSTAGSYYLDSSQIYLHTYNGDEPTNSNIVVNNRKTKAPINIENIEKKVKVYLENIEVIGGYNGNVCAYASSKFYPSVYAKDCKFLFNKSEISQSFSACTMRGTDSIFQNCEASYGNNDGFNYHKFNDTICVAIEIDCTAKNNGLGWKIANCNGSTIHDGSKILRLNGEYSGSYGGNVVDVGAGSVSVNLGVYAHDSQCSETNGFSCDFGIQSGGTEMYLYNCKAKGSYYNLYSTSHATIYIHVCQYQSSISTPENFGLIVEI